MLPTFCTPPTLPWRPQKPPQSPICACTPPAQSALDTISATVKLNAVAEALARRQDYSGMLKILDEMIQAGVSLESKSLSSIIDSTLPSPPCLAALLRKTPPPGYGLHRESPMQGENQDAVDPARALDVSLAAGFLGVVGLAVSAEVVQPALTHHAADDATTVLGLLVVGLVFDRYAAAASTWRRIEGGMKRLFADDPVRSARVDAAYFVTAYLLGLPWLCFRPDVTQIFAVEGEMDEGKVQDYLTWLVAGVAVEDEMDGMLIEADLRGARRFLRKVGGGEVEARIRGGVAAAKALLRSHEKVHGMVVDRMLRGESAGACTAAVAAMMGT